MKFILIILTFFFIGCVDHQSLVKKKVPHEELNILLVNLDKSIDTKEAKSLAIQSIDYSNQLIKYYDLVAPPLFHNFLVNTGVKTRGLCWHFASDMLEHSLKQDLQSFDFYIGGANINDYWEEHNTLVVTCKGCSFSEGIVLDPWRNSGKLFFSKVKDDKDYKWSQRGGLRN